MKKALAVLVVILVATGSARAESAPVAPRKTLKICAPPYNLPMSNQDLAGYENKMAALFGTKLGLPVEYTWFPQRMGFIRNTLKNNETDDGSYKCDLVMGVVDNFELAATTRPYMHSTWAMVYVKGRGLDFIKTQNDLKDLTEAQKAALRIGIWDQGPATEWIYHLELMEHATPYTMLSGDPKEGPGHIIENELIPDKINLTFVWGPIAGYLAKQHKDSELVVIPLQNEFGIKFDFQIAMAVRQSDTAWKQQIDDLIAANQPRIDSILKDYGVPLLPLEPEKRKKDDD